MLLNTTIRFVEHDTFTFLSYAGAPGGSHAVRALLPDPADGRGR